MKVWNVTCRDSSGVVRAEFPIYANTVAQAMKEAARNLARQPYVKSVELVYAGTTAGEM